MDTRRLVTPVTLDQSLEAIMTLGVGEELWRGDAVTGWHLRRKRDETNPDLSN
jgi:hypothetical protein